MATLKCKASEGRIVVYVGDHADGDPPVTQTKALADARAFGIELGEEGTFSVRLVAEEELPTVADVLHSAFAFPLDVAGPVHLGTKLGESQGQWAVDDGAYWGALYEVFPDCEESIGAQYVLLLAKEGTVPEPRWPSMPHLTDSARTPGGAPFPDALALPGDALDDAALPDLRALFGGAGGGGSSSSSKPAKANTGEKQTSDAVASRLFAAIAGLGGDNNDNDNDNDNNNDNDNDNDNDNSPAQNDPFVAFIETLIAQEQIELIEGASPRKLAERLELALERDPMMFRRPGDWFFEQNEVDELFASDEDLITSIQAALGH